MNLFQDNSLIEALRRQYDLSIVQAVAVLVAYQFGTISTMSAQVVIGSDSRGVSGRSMISHPVRIGIMKEVGKGRVKLGSRPSTIYELVDRDTIHTLITDQQAKNDEMSAVIASQEQAAREILDAGI